MSTQQRFRHFAALLIGLALSPAAVAFAQLPTAIEHFPVTSARQGSEVEIRARLNLSGGQPLYVRVYYKSLDEQQYRFQELVRSADGYSGFIPAAGVQPPVVQYFILALFGNQQLITLPASNPYGNPFEIVVERVQGTPAPTSRPGGQATTPRPGGQPVRQQPAEITAVPAAPAGNVAGIILSPEPLAEIGPEEVLIAAALHGGERGLDLSSVRVQVDGRDFTRHADVTEHLITLSPRRVAAGSHSVTISARDRSGAALPPLNWRFFVVSRQDLPYSETARNHRGRVYAEVRQENFSGQRLSANNLGGNTNGEANGIGYNAQVFITALEDSRQQPRNRFSLNLVHNLFEAGAGDLYPYYNDLILWGRRVRGFSGALKLGIINFHYTTGTTNRHIPALRPDSTAAPIAFGTYEQQLQAARVSFGRGRTFQFGLNLLQVRDDAGSLGLGESLIAPKDNLVAGADLLLRFDNHRIELKGSVASSLYTQDISGGPAPKDSIESRFDIELPFDPGAFEKWLIINESTTPLDPRDLTSVAYQVSLRLNYFRNYLQFGVKRLGSVYTSLGHSYLRTNISGFYIKDRISLAQNRLHVNLGIDSYKDNFRANDGNPTTDLTTFNFSVTAFPGGNYPMINFGWRNNVRNNGIDALSPIQSPIGTVDTSDVREASVTRDLSLNLSQNFTTGEVKHTAGFSLISSRLIDEFGGTRLTGTAARDFASFVQSITLRSDFRQPLTTVVSFATNNTANAGNLNEVDFVMFTGRVEYRFMQERLSTYTGFRTVAADGQRLDNNQQPLAMVDYLQTSFQFGCAYTVQQRHRFVFDADLIRFRDNGQVFQQGSTTAITNPSFNNSIVRLLYEFRY